MASKAEVRVVELENRLEAEKKARNRLVAALSAYRSALRSGEPESTHLEEMGHKAFEASHRLTTEQ